MDIGIWLRTLGLEEYDAAFRANAIDVDVLCDLTDVTGGVDPRIDGEGCSGDDKGAVEAAGLFTGMAIQSDGLSVVSSV